MNYTEQEVKRANELGWAGRNLGKPCVCTPIRCDMECPACGGPSAKTPCVRVEIQRNALKVENARLRALLILVLDARERQEAGIPSPISGDLTYNIRATLAATKDAALTCVKCGEIEGAHDEQEVVQVGHEFIAPKK